MCLRGLWILDQTKIKKADGYEVEGCEQIARGRQPRARGAQQGWRLRQNKWGWCSSQSEREESDRSKFRDHLPILCSQDITRSLDPSSIRESVELFLKAFVQDC